MFVVVVFWSDADVTLSGVSSGIVTSSQMFSSGYGGAVFAGILMLIIGLMFGALAALDFFMLLRVSIYSTISIGIAMKCLYAVYARDYPIA